MNKLRSMILLMAGLFTLSANAQLKDYEVQDYDIVGSFRSKSYHDFGTRLTAELFEEAAKSDRLFESMELELEIGFLNYFKGVSRFSRSVNVDNPKVEGTTLSPLDIGQYRVTNSLYTGIEADVTGALWRPNARAGVLFSVSSKKFPAINTMDGAPKSDDTIEDICKRAKKTYNPILQSAFQSIDNKEKTAQQLERDKIWQIAPHSCLKEMDKDDKRRDPNVRGPQYDPDYNGENWYETFVQWLNYPIKKIAQEYFVDSMKKIIYTDNSVEAMTNYSRFGFPVALNAFYDDNAVLSVGDSVQHTSFLGLDPTRIGMLTSFSTHIFRFAKDIRIRKEGRNKVTVQVTEYTANGEDFQLFRFRPRILWVLKYKFGENRAESFDTFTYKRTYEADLSIDTHAQFVQNILNNAYIPDFGLKRYKKKWKNEDLPDGLVAKEPVFIEGKLETYRFLLRLPGVFNIDSGSNSRIQQARIGDDTRQAEGNKEFYDHSRWSILDWLFPQVDRRTKCSLNAKTYAACDVNLGSEEEKAQCEDRMNTGGGLSSKIALNLDCMHSEAYPERDWPMDAWDTAQMIRDGEADVEFRERLANLDIRNAGTLKFNSNTSFNYEHVNSILQQATYDRVALELVEIFFGGKYREIWQKTGVRRVFHNIRQAADLMDGPYMERYTPLRCVYTDGIVQPRKGFKDLFLTFVSGKDFNNHCVTFVRRIIEPLVRSISDIREQDNVMDRLDELMQAYNSENISVAIAVLMKRLSGETADNPVRYTYSVDGSNMLESIRYSNGAPYHVTHASIEDDVVDAAEFRDRRERLTNGLLLRKRGDTAMNTLRLDLFSTHKFPAEARLEVEIRELVTYTKNHEKSKVRQTLPRSKKSSKYRIPLKGVKDLDRIINGANYVYDDLEIQIDPSVRKGKNNVMYLRVLNANGDWLSEEQVFQFNMMRHQ